MFYFLTWIEMLLCYRKKQSTTLQSFHKALPSSDRSDFGDITSLLPVEDLYKLNIDMHGPFQRDWEWRFGKPLQYESRKLYSLLHQWHPLSPILNARWVSSDPEVHWICRLHSVWSFRLSYKFWICDRLVVYQGLPSKACLAKSRLSNELCPFIINQRPWSIFYGTVAFLD